MKERADEYMPEIIRRYLFYPYLYFSKYYGDSSYTLLDIACGKCLQKDILSLFFKKVIFADNVSLRKDILNTDIRNISLSDKSVDVTFCFETIEHIIEHQEAIRELKRVTKKIIVIGSVNKLGPTHINNTIIYKGEKNFFHKKELSHKDFSSLHKDMQLYSLIYHNDSFSMKKGLSKEGIANYGIINL